MGRRLPVDRQRDDAGQRRQLALQAINKLLLQEGLAFDRNRQPFGGIGDPAVLPAPFRKAGDKRPHAHALDIACNRNDKMFGNNIETC